MDNAFLLHDAKKHMLKKTPVLQPFQNRFTHQHLARWALVCDSLLAVLLEW